MRKLLLLLFAAAFPMTASAQWNFDTVFPSDTLETDGNGMQGVAVDGDGKVWLQPFGPTDSVQVAGLNDTFQPVRVLHVFNPDGTEASFSPVKFIEFEDGVTPRDTLGGELLINASGEREWFTSSTRSGRGLRAGPDGNIYVSQDQYLYKLNSDTGEGIARAFIPTTEYCALTQVSLDDNGNVYTAPVCPAAGAAIRQYDSNLNFIANAVAEASNFSRTTLVSPDGNTLFDTAFENPFTIVYQRPDEFSEFDSIGVTLAGLRVESTAINPSTGRYWFSAGNPLNLPNQYINPADSTLLETNFSETTWYAYNFDDLFDADGNPVLTPTPVDSLKYSEPGAGRPRGLAFSPDGDTAYVVLFSAAGAVQRFTRGDGGNTSSEEIGTFAGALEQNRPNPFAGTTQIEFDLERASSVTLRVYDATGREVATLADGQMAAGPHSVSFDAGPLAAGVYVYTLDIEGEISSRRMMVIR
ncbi:T9SS type A sorting domain-containing protein [Rubrivirga sp.]|uniref:T9SS type A sorting domain-containing protein n=1 Tax=Rubrivirga sp. TaxID=1885344 RepID=UPI003C72BE18